jgi:hypothetical protein
MRFVLQGPSWIIGLGAGAPGANGAWYGVVDFHPSVSWEKAILDLGKPRIGPRVDNSLLRTLSQFRTVSTSADSLLWGASGHGHPFVRPGDAGPRRPQDPQRYEEIQKSSGFISSSCSPRRTTCADLRHPWVPDLSANSCVMFRDMFGMSNFSLDSVSDFGAVASTALSLIACRTSIPALNASVLECHDLI